MVHHQRSPTTTIAWWLAAVVATNVLGCLLTKIATTRLWSYSRASSRRLQTECSPNYCLCPTPSPTPFQYDYTEQSFKTYTTPESPSWPSNQVWQNDLASKLSPEASLSNHLSTSYSNRCDSLNSVESVFTDICMSLEGCDFEFCNRDGTQSSNIPAYTVKVMTPGDIQVSLQFANTHNIAVTIKTTGHSFHGASIKSGSLNIWMAHYPRDDTITNGFTDSCGTTYATTTIGVGGGELWDDVLNAVGEDHHVVSGNARSVSAVGGWLQGVGLSRTHRRHGVGIDNVLSMTVMLADGSPVIADACQNEDLFWALRGGGGGTFGVVTHAQLKLHPPTKVTVVSVWAEEDAKRVFLDYWLDKLLSANNRLSGAWFTPTWADIHIVDDPDDFYLNQFLEEYDDWLDNVLRAKGNKFEGGYDIDRFDSWFDEMGGPDAYRNTDSFDARFGIDGFAGAGSRILPRQVLENRKEEVIDMLLSLDNVGGYWLGGKITEVDPDDTAVHPAMRSGIYAISTFSTEDNDKVRDFVSNDETGCSFNHHSSVEPDWRNALWGTEHYRRLLGIKNRYDPDRRFNCWHCVGYVGEEYAES